MPQGITLQADKYYRLKVATTDLYGWKEFVKNFHTYSEISMEINGIDPFYDIYGEDVTLRNTTITDNISVVAHDFVYILPNSYLESGIYSIEKSLNCDFFAYNLPKNNPIVQGENKRGEIDYKKSEVIDLKEDIKNVDDSFIVYPNPTTGRITINHGEKFNNGEISLFNIFGRELVQKKIQGGATQLDLSGFSNGIYYMLIKVDGQVIRRKVVKQ